MTEPACSSGPLTNVLPHRNVLLQTQIMTPLPVTVYRLAVVLSIDVERHTGKNINSKKFKGAGQDVFTF